MEVLKIISFGITAEFSLLVQESSIRVAAKKIVLAKMLIELVTIFCQRP